MSAATWPGSSHAADRPPAGGGRSGLPGLHTESFGSGPELVMVHGWAMHSGVWRDFAMRLGSRLRVTLVDLPGHGASETLAEFSLDSVTTALAGIAPPRAYWLGWSLGALFGLRLAECAPERVAGLVMLAGSPRFTAAADWPGVEPALLAQVAANLDTDFAGTLRRFIGLQTFGQDNARALARAIEARLAEFPPPPASALHGGLKVLQTTDLRAAWRCSEVPSLAVLGAHDRLVPKAVAGALMTLTARSETQVLTAAAHLPFATHPAQTAELILDFIDRREREISRNQ